MSFTIKVSNGNAGNNADGEVGYFGFFNFSGEHFSLLDFSVGRSGWLSEQAVALQDTSTTNQMAEGAVTADHMNGTSMSTSTAQENQVSMRTTDGNAATSSSADENGASTKS